MYSIALVILECKTKLLTFTRFNFKAHKLFVGIFVNSSVLVNLKLVYKDMYLTNAFLFFAMVDMEK